MTSTTIESSTRPMGIPRIPGRPVIGNTIEFIARPLGFLIDAYHNYGPVFRMDVPMSRAVVIAGALADQTLRGEAQMDRQGLFRPFSTEVGVDVFEMEGEPHRRMRGLLREPYSRQLVAQFTPEMLQLVEDAVADWYPGQSLDLFAEAAKLALFSAMAIVTPINLRTAAADISAAGGAVMYAAFRLLPYSTLKVPSYRRARQRMAVIIDEAIARHRRGELTSETKTYMIDACLRASNSAGDRMTDRDVRGACFYGLAGTEIYIGRLIGFMIFELLRNRHYLERVLAEIDGIWAASEGADALREMPCLRAAYSETLRMYPLIPAYPYTAQADVMIGGHAIPRGQLVLFAPHVAHFCDEQYDNPMAFEPERFLPPRREGTEAKLFASFGTGAHACSAQGLVETITLTIVCALLRRVRLGLARPSYRMQLRMTPLIAPREAIELRVEAKRSGAAPPVAANELSARARAETKS